MRIRYVENIAWSGGALSTYAILKDGPLEADSIVPAPSLFLTHLAQKGHFKNSLKAAADDLKSFFQALSDHDQDWRNLSDTDMSGYLYSHLAIQREFKDESIQRHISTLRAFYSFAWQTGLLISPPKFSYTYRTTQLKKQGDAKKKVNFDLYNQYVDKSLFETLLGNVITKSDFEKERDELVLQLGYHCGLRSSEVTDPRNLITSDLRKLIASAEKIESQTITVSIIGKGEKLRKVDIHPKAFRKIKFFIEGRRNSIPEGSLICKANGSSLSREHATYVFRVAKKSASSNIGTVIAKLHKEDPLMHFISDISFYSLTFHAMRHTYATNLVDFCYKHGYDPWQYVPEQMGHEDEETTEEYVVFDGKLHRREKIRRALNDDSDD